MLSPVERDLLGEIGAAERRARAAHERLRRFGAAMSAVEQLIDRGNYQAAKRLAARVKRNLNPEETFSR